MEILWQLKSRTIGGAVTDARECAYLHDEWAVRVGRCRVMSRAEEFRFAVAFKPI